MTNREEENEYVLHTVAIVAARKAAGLEFPTKSPEDPWWSEGPHIVKDGRSYYVHALGCFQSQLARVTREHPDWYLVTAVVRGRGAEIHGLGDSLITLGELEARRETLTPDDMRLAIELTPNEKRERWGVSLAET